jgi:type VI secretion system protein ImpK
MTIDDPFAEPADSERTVIRPNPGGRRPVEPVMPQPSPAAGYAPAYSPPRQVQPAAPAHIDLKAMARLNPLITAALPILDLVVQIKNRAVHNNIEHLRDRVVAEINAFERRITPLGLSPQTIRASRYALCATIDDVVLNTPWGSRSIWTQRSMVGSFHNEVLGGDRFWELVNQLKKDAAINLDLLELLYCCISLGFEGKYRVMQRGASELFQVREDLYRVIRNNRGDFERSLSPHWQGAAKKHKGLAMLIPNWVVAVVALGVLALAYAIFIFLLNARSDVVYESLNALPPTGPVLIARAQAAPAMPPPPPAAQAQGLRQFLAPEIAQGLVTVLEDGQTITVRIRGQGVFASGSADVQPAFLPLLDRIGAGIDDQPGPVDIIGHTDNQQIRSLKFPSNYQLSLVRAQGVANIIKRKLKDPARVTAEGKGDSVPVASNATPEGREQNRRIEVVIQKTDER